MSTIAWMSAMIRECYCNWILLKSLGHPKTSTKNTKNTSVSKPSAELSHSSIFQICIRVDNSATYLQLSQMYHRDTTALRQSRHHKIDPLLFLVEAALRFASFQHLLLRDTEATQILAVLSGVLQKQYKTIKPLSKATKEDFLVKCCGKFDWQRHGKAF